MDGNTNKHLHDTYLDSVYARKKAASSDSKRGRAQNMRALIAVSRHNSNLKPVNTNTTTNSPNKLYVIILHCYKYLIVNYVIIIIKQKL